MSQGPIGVVLLNMGGPDSLDAVEPFLFNLFRDNDLITLPFRGWIVQRPFARWVAHRRSSTVREFYRRIGGRSPIAEITQAQATALEARLNRAAPGRFRCYVAMRYWHPFTDEAIAAMARDGVETLVALTLYPHYTSATTGSSLRELGRQLDRSSLHKAPRLDIDRFYDHPLYLDAMATEVRAGLERFPEHERAKVVILFSAHGLPLRFIHRGDPYLDHLYCTIAGVLARVALATGRVHPWRLAFQSRATRARWLSPSTDATLAALAAEGHRAVLAVPISFVSEHIETLYEIDLLFGEEAKRLGLNMQRAAALGASPTFIEALANLVEVRLGTVKELPVPSAQG